MPEYIEVGFTALRDPATGEFLPSVPLYIEKTKEAAASEETLIRDLGKLFAQKIQLYMDAEMKESAPSR